MTVSKYHSLIATGNAFGQVITWDLETAKILQVHIAVGDEKITLLEFLDAYPILVCGGSDGSISLWATRGAPITSRYDCLGRFRNTVQELYASDTSANGISCGTSEILKVNHKYKIYESDYIHFDQHSFSEEIYRSEE